MFNPDDSPRLPEFGLRPIGAILPNLIDQIARTAPEACRFNRLARQLRAAHADRLLPRTLRCVR